MAFLEVASEPAPFVGAAFVEPYLEEAWAVEVVVGVAVEVGQCFAGFVGQ